MGIPPPRDAAAPFFVFLRRSLPYVWGIGVGIAFAGMVIGWDFIAGEQLVVRQVAGDNAAGLAAFRAYLNDGWRWPLLATPGFGETGVNVAFSDSIPLLAMSAKLARPLGIEAESWWGGWFGFVYGLQGAAAVFAVRSWGARSAAAQFAAPLMAVSMPVLLLQTVHPSLSAHGVLLLGWGLAGRARHGRSASAALGGFAALTLASIAIHPYLGAMVAVLALGVAGDAVLGGRLGLRSAIVWFGGLLALVGVWTIVGGYLDAVGPSDGGYGQYATSALGPVVPTLSSFLDGSPTGFEIQPSHPGYAYAGLGLIGLAGFVTIVHRRRLVATGRANQLLAVAVLTLGVWAVSPWVRLTTGDAFDIPAALAFRLGSPRRAGVVVSVAGLVAATAVLALVLGFSRRGSAAGSDRSDASSIAPDRAGADHSVRLGGFTPAVVSGAVLVFGASLVGLVVPDLLGAVMTQFRASGRFFWPVLYGVLTIAVAAADPVQLRSSLPSSPDRPRLASARVLSVGLLAAAVIVQLADTTTLRRFAHDLLVPGGLERRDFMAGLVDLVEAHDHVVLGPDFRCTYYPDGVGAFIDVTGAASAADRPIDRIYSARRPQTEPCTVAQDVDLSDPGALVVLVEPVAVLTDENRDDDVTGRCRQWATLNVCSHRWAEAPPEILAYFGPVAD
jgi:hypothetical protein